MIGIYKITSPSGKLYIGQSIDIKRRWEEYNKLRRCDKQIILYNSLKKYGPENHRFEIIEECEEKQLLERETYWKNFYKVLDIPSLCCRMDGRGGKLSQKTKDNISKSNKDKAGKYNRTKIIRNKTSKANSVIIYQFTLKGKLLKKWNSINKAELKYGKGIKDNLINKTKKSHGYVWSYNNIFPGYNKFHGNSIIILQKSLDNVILKEWNSITEIEEKLGYPTSNISSVCRKKQKTAYGFIWGYK